MVELKTYNAERSRKVKSGLALGPKKKVKDFILESMTQLSKEQLMQIPTWLPSTPDQWIARTGAPELIGLAEAPPPVQELIRDLLQVDPAKRIASATQALERRPFGARSASARHTKKPDRNLFRTIEEIRDKMNVFKTKLETEQELKPVDFEFGMHGHGLLMARLRQEAVDEIAQIRDIPVLPKVRRSSSSNSKAKRRKTSSSTHEFRRLCSLERLIKETNRAYHWSPSDGDTKPVSRSKAEAAAVQRRLASLRPPDRTYIKRTSEDEY